MTRVTSDELEYVSATLCAKNPGVDQHDIARLVYDVYEELASQARCTTHLIPLTLNVSRRRLADAYGQGVGARAAMWRAAIKLNNREAPIGLPPPG